MSFGDVVALIAVLAGSIAFTGILLSAYQSRLANRERELELRARITEAEAKSGRSELTRLEQRTRVLERIATDGKTKLASEIEALRDERSLAE